MSSFKRLRDPLTRKEIWKLTDDPTAHTFHTYHNVEAFSPDGRYVAYVESDQGTTRAGLAHIHVYDLAEQELRERRLGATPVWSPAEPLLAFVHDDVVFSWNMETDEVRELARDKGIRLGGVERTGRWVIAFYTWDIQPSRIARVAMDGSGSVETLFECGRDEWASMPCVSPAEDLLSFRFHAPPENGEGGGFRKRLGLPFEPRDFIIMGTDGSSPHPSAPDGGWGHHNWTGDGQWFMVGGLWKRVPVATDAPWQCWRPGFGFNHQGPCGRDGRLIVGDFGNHLTYIYNLETQELTLMNAPASTSVPYSKNADPHPIGSPDGTKYVFDSMYDLEHAPLTRLASSIRPVDDVIPVESTAGFPDSGRLVIGITGYGPEIIEYTGRDDTNFRGCKRGAPPVVSSDTVFDGMSAGDKPTAFSRGMLVRAYHGLHLAPGKRREPDVHIQVVRPPEHPRSVRATREPEGVAVTWTAPENAREIATYELWRSEGADDWQALAKVPASELELLDSEAPNGPLRYAVTSVEHSGLTSARSATAVVTSRQGAGMVEEILLPIGAAWPLAPTLLNPDPKPTVRHSLDDNAYNRRALIIHDSTMNFRFMVELPRAVSAHVHVHVRGDDKPALLRLLFRGASYDNLVAGEQYDWTPAAVDGEGRSIPIAFSSGVNELVFTNPMPGWLHVDMIRLRPCGAD